MLRLNGSIPGSTFRCANCGLKTASRYLRQSLMALREPQPAEADIEPADFSVFWQGRTTTPAGSRRRNRARTSASGCIRSTWRPCVDARPIP